MNENKPTAKEERRDPLVPDAAKEQAGTHSLGASAGAAAGAAAGAVSGLVFGPLGSLAGAVGGAAVGGAAGVATGGTSDLDFDPSPWDAYWRENYASRPYVGDGASFDDYGPAFRYGTLSYARTDHPREWHEVESELESGWESARGTSRLGWNEAKLAVRDAWNRMHDPSGARP
jgi:hypothetical protein